MPRIFISYRRSDSAGTTGRIYDHLVTAFGRENIFKDVDDIPLGVDFAAHLDREIAQCQVVLAIIGRTWVTVTETGSNRRLDNPNDLVRIEIESALNRDIPVIPVLLDGVIMPKQTQLPSSLQLLARRNGISVGHDPRFHSDVTRLIKGIQTLLTSPKITDAETISIFLQGNNVMSEVYSFNISLHTKILDLRLNAATLTGMDEDPESCKLVLKRTKENLPDHLTIQDTNICDGDTLIVFPKRPN